MKIRRFFAFMLLGMALCLAACGKSGTADHGTVIPFPVSSLTPVETAAPTATVAPTAPTMDAPIQQPSPTQTAEPTPTPTPTPTSTENERISITKHPGTDNPILEGNTSIYTAKADNASISFWEIAKPDESKVYVDTELEKDYPGVKVQRPDGNTVWIVSTPLTLEGFKVRAVFENGVTRAYSDWAIIHVRSFFAQIAGNYVLTSGAGAWSTELTIKADGSFTGHYQDWDAVGPNGETGSGYLYECDFSGSFGKVGRIGTYTYTMEMGTLKQEGTIGSTYVDDQGMTHQIAAPSGFDKAGLFYVYFPDIDVKDTDSGFQTWAAGYGKGSGTLGCYGLYNFYGKLGFIQN